MKYFLMTLSIFSMLGASYAEDFTSMDIKPGLWKTTTKMDENSMISKMAATLGADQKKALEKMMKDKMGATKSSNHCMTKEMINNPQKAYENSMKNPKMKELDCKVEFKKQTAKENVGVFNCSHQGQKLTSEFHWKAISRTKTTFKTIMNLPMVGKQELSAESVWINDECL